MIKAIVPKVLPVVSALLTLTGCGLNTSTSLGSNSPIQTKVSQNEYQILTDEEVASEIKKLLEHYQTSPQFQTQNWNPLTLIDNAMNSVFQRRLNETEKKVLQDNPQLINPTRDATLAIVVHFNRGISAYNDKKPNAVQHAWWNALIAKYAYTQRILTKEQSLGWAKTFTDAHEAHYNAKDDNAVKARTMDLHNNRLGRLVYRDNSTKDVPYETGMKKVNGFWVKQFELRTVAKSDYDLLSDLNNHNYKKFNKAPDVNNINEKTLVYFSD